MPYSATTWVNNTTPAINATNLNNLTAELILQAAARNVSHSLPTWANGVAPAVTDPTPLNEMERVAQAVAVSLGLSYSTTAWQTGWVPARNAANLNKLEAQAAANRTAIDTPPPPGTLAWQPPGYPSYAGYESYTLGASDAAPTAALSSGRNVIFHLPVARTAAVDLSGWNNVVIIGGAWNYAIDTQLSRCIRVGNCTGVVHLEGLDMGKTSTYLDATVGVSTGPGSATPGARVQIQNCRIYSGYQSNIGSGTHNDCVQNWDGAPANYGGGARGYRFDHCTIIAGYQGTYFWNGTGGSSPMPIGNEDSYIQNTNYKTAANYRLQSPIWFWKTWRTDPWGYHTIFRFNNVYMELFVEGYSIVPNVNGGGTTVAAADNVDRGYTLKSDGQGSYVEWKATSDQQGIIRVNSAPAGGDFCPAGVPGTAYSSPGYL